MASASTCSILKEARRCSKPTNNVSLHVAAFFFLLLVSFNFAQKGLPKGACCAVKLEILCHAAEPAFIGY